MKLDPKTKKLRCAVYTRKSSEEGLDQDYNSIDAQRDAGHAYIISQQHEGWIAVEHDYDDPAYSGGSLERPAIQRLLRDIEAGLIDIVVVYKIDRLTRSLADFARMIELFEQHNVSFVSVTQQFNTTNSMGRLMLNILLSFAQFEREVTGERIRDKITASKKKGLWMGGIPPLGYDVNNRKLIINEKEADSVRHIFRRFTELGSATPLYQELKDAGVHTKAWTTLDGKVRKGQPINRGHVYKILHNRTYLGDIRHKDQWYPGIHKAIVDQALWDSTHAILENNTRTRGNHLRAKVPFLLKGLVFDRTGRALTCWSSAKKSNGRRYRYYISARDNKEYTGSSGLPRIPAADLESAVVQQLKMLLRTPELTARTTEALKGSQINFDEAKTTVALTNIEALWDTLFPSEQRRILELLVEKIIVMPDRLELRLHDNGFEHLETSTVARV